MTGECDWGFVIEKMKPLIEAAYREGVSHGESKSTAYEWGGRGDSDHCWEASDVKAEMDRVITSIGAA